MDSTLTQQKIIQALSRSDESTRVARANRIEWLAEFDSRPIAFLGAIDTNRLLDEARVCFINSQYVAVILLVTAFVEHTLADELNELKLIKVRKPTLEGMIQLAKVHLDFIPKDILDGANNLRSLRNPLTHRRPETDENTLSYRFQSSGIGPNTILQKDAESALIVMYGLFKSTLRQA